MLNVKSLTIASAAVTLYSGVNAALYPLKRNDQPAQPSCTEFTPFKYAGCFVDSGRPRTLLYTGPRLYTSQTVQQCVAFCKGKQYQYAGLEYGEECFCGASVNNIQVDESDCNQPCTGDSSEICGAFDRISIYQDPTFPVADYTTISDYQQLGCHSEGSNGRSLAWRQDQVDSTTLTVKTCLRACKAGGWSFAGLEYASECYCGVALGIGTLPIDDSTCNMPCNGDATETCGGRNALDLFVAKDLESSEPCEGGSSSPLSSLPAAISSLSSSSTRTMIPSSTKTSASLCTSTVTVSPTATCEYKCGNWCSNPIPAFTDKFSCWEAFSSCTVQVASCFLQAGFPDSLNCFEFSSWCISVSQYCTSYCPGKKCSKQGLRSKYPPSGPSPPSATISTSVYTCPAPTAKPSATSTTATSTSYVPVPINMNICNQPNNPRKGYGSNTPVGGIALPCLTCNNMYSEYKDGFHFKLYTSPKSEDCPSYPRSGNSGLSHGCQDACDSQYKSCVNTYAQGCKDNKRGDSFATASSKCKNQWHDCYNANSNVQPGSRCDSFNSGWY
ncbi:hypothetical protein JHW43_006802 [Diplocarpon mali]|nr:hypothetical protein JHW43_006802 [Diplocarpon mali]